MLPLLVTKLAKNIADKESKWQLQENPKKLKIRLLGMETDEEQRVSVDPTSKEQHQTEEKRNKMSLRTLFL